MSTIVAAIGGNALRAEDGVGAPAEWFEALAKALPPLLDVVAAGHRLVLTHGNGPQVGEELLRMEIAKPVISPLTFDLCVAETQGSLGYVIQQTLGNMLRDRGLSTPVVALVTQVVVDAHDLAFARATKPIGPFYTKGQAQRLARDHGWQIVEDAGRGWRRAVPSPRPLRVVELSLISSLLAAGAIVVAAGGGGVPVIDTRGGLRGVDAVIEKDLATSVLATALGADVALFLTGVDAVAMGYGTPQQRPLSRLTPAEGRRLCAAGAFPPGSMGPKVEAAIEFVERGGSRAIITSLERVREALAGHAGTQITTSASETTPEHGLP